MRGIDELRVEIQMLKGNDVYTDELVRIADAIERELEERYVELPKDADGEHIHIGDEMEGVDKYDSLKKVMGKVITVSFESDGTTDVAIQAWSSDGKSWHRAYLDSYASVYRHHHAPTVEDVLWEFADIAREEVRLFNSVSCDTIAEYAAKLQLRDERDDGDEEERC